MKGPPINTAAARTVLSTVRKSGMNKNITLKKIQEYLKSTYPSTQKELEKINNTIRRAMTFGEKLKKKQACQPRTVKGREKKRRRRTKSRKIRRRR